MLYLQVSTTDHTYINTEKHHKSLKVLSQIRKHLNKNSQETNQGKINAFLCVEDIECHLNDKK